MRKDNTVDNISAKHIAGNITELTLWRFVKDISNQLSKLHEATMTHGDVNLNNITIIGKEFLLGNGNGKGSISADIWDLGACIYELVTGTTPFGGKGKEGQSELSPIPSFSESKVSKSLSILMIRCLEYKDANRISSKEVAAIAEKELSLLEQYVSNTENLKYKQPQNRQIRMKTYNFWPEVMACLAIMVTLLIPQDASAQYNVEMEKLIRLTTTMRNQKMRTQVLNELKADSKWTLMDELKRDQNECTYSDKVNMFGMNDIAAEIAQREKGIINVGGRFKHSADGKHNYSFTELTAIAGTTISYDVKDHKGIQQIAVVPFDPKNKYTALFYTDGIEQKAHSVKDGISYFTINVDKRGNYEFEITNNDGKNASYVVITFNPMK